MTIVQNSKVNSQEIAKNFLEKFGFEEKLNEIYDKRDESLIPIFTANLAVFGVSFAVLFSKDDTALTASILLLTISAMIAFLGALLNIWYLVRLKKRVSFLKEEQGKVSKKAEIKLIKTFDLLSKIIKTSIYSKFSILKETGLEKNKLLDELEKDDNLNFLAEDSMFIPLTIMELALKETLLNIDECLNKPLDEKYSEFKLFIDRLSDKSKNWALVLGSVFMMASLLVKFIIG